VLILTLYIDGLAVNVVLILTTIQFCIVMRARWNVPWVFVILFAFIFGSLELAFLVATGEKVRAGGWIAVLYGLLFFAIMMCWHIGRKVSWCWYDRI